MLSPELNATLNRIGQKIVDRLKDDIKNKRITKYGAVNSSGRLADSVAYQVTESSLVVTADDYIYYLQFGRKPGKFPPKQPILEWIRSKPINSDISEDSLAFLIQRKISKEGTSIYQQGSSTLISGEFFQSILDELSGEIIKSVTSDIIDAL